MALLFLQHRWVILQFWKIRLISSHVVALSPGKSKTRASEGFGGSKGLKKSKRKKRKKERGFKGSGGRNSGEHS